MLETQELKAGESKGDLGGSQNAVSSPVVS